MNRRNLLRATACATAGLLAGLRPAFAADAEIDVSPQAAGPLISPHIYGHFIEHLGAVIYDGIWVGRDSRSEEHTSELQSLRHLVCRLLLEKKENCASNWSCSQPESSRVVNILLRKPRTYGFFFFKAWGPHRFLPFSPTPRFSN